MCLFNTFPFLTHCCTRSPPLLPLFLWLFMNTVSPHLVPALHDRCASGCPCDPPAPHTVVGINFSAKQNIDFVFEIEILFTLRLKTYLIRIIAPLLPRRRLTGLRDPMLQTASIFAQILCLLVLVQFTEITLHKVDYIVQNGVTMLWFKNRFNHIFEHFEKLIIKLKYVKTFTTSQ